MKGKLNQLFLLRLSNKRYFGAGNFLKAFKLMFHKSFMISFRFSAGFFSKKIRSRHFQSYFRIQYKYGKIRTRKYPYLDTFHVVCEPGSSNKKSSKCLGRYENKLFVKSKKAEVVVRRCSSRQFFLKILQIQHKSTCEKPYNFIKQRLHHKCFPVRFDKFLGTPFFTEHPRGLLLKK